MGKRKTRKEKIRLGLKKQAVGSFPEIPQTIINTTEPVYTVQTPTTMHTPISTTIAINNYQTTISEVKKTAAIVTFLMIFQLILFTLLRLHILKIPYLNY